MTAKYGIPYFANFINSDMNPEDARSMCCRLRLDNRELRKRGGGLFGSNPLTGSIGVVTINLPRIGYLAKNEKDFFARLVKLMNLAKEALEVKRKALESFTEKGLYPYSAFYLRNLKQTTGKYWKNHFSTIGIIGMNEAVLNFIGKNLGSEEAIRFAQKVLDFMREKLADYQEKTGEIYNLEATPAEGASYSLARIDKRRYPKMKVHHRGKEESYYTNSTQLPVGFTDDIFEALDLQDDLQIKYTGGTVLHGFLGERMPSITSVKKLIKKIAENYRLPYFTLTPNFSICGKHGYISGEHLYCPQCKQEGKRTKCEVYSRVVGYLRPVSQWNNGKQQEFKDRKTYDKQLKP
jgi:ribonucleoside-triphosphate reductase